MNDQGEPQVSENPNEVVNTLVTMSETLTVTDALSGPTTNGNTVWYWGPTSGGQQAMDWGLFQWG